MHNEPVQPDGSFESFVELIARLRAPGGCPWDSEQTHASIASNMIEEAYEAVEAIEKNDIAGLREELGDVLLQVVFQAQIAADNHEFAINDVIESISSKIIRRHPHVFGEESVGSAEQTLQLWDRIKQGEKAKSDKGLLADIPTAMPALMRAQDISRKVVGVGFEWEGLGDVIEKLDEEVQEFCAAEPGSDHAIEELGDVLFTVVNLGRKQGIDSETALRRACDKFISRWEHMEAVARTQQRPISDYNSEELEVLWGMAKREERDYE